MVKFHNIQSLFTGVVFCLMITSSAEVHSQDEPYVMRLGEVATITFPSEPVLNDTGRDELYRVENQNGLFQALFVKSHLSPTIQLEPVEKIEELYLGYVDGMTNKMKGKLISMSYSKLKGYVYVDARLNYFEPNTGVLMTIKCRVITILGRIYNVMYTNTAFAFDDSPDTCDDFLNSFNLLIDANGESLNEGGPLYESEAKTVGETIWRSVIAIFVIIGITLVGVYFATRKSKTKKSNEV